MINETLTHSETLKPYTINLPAKQSRRWSLCFESCISCGTKQFPHAARGLCTQCYKIENKDRNNALRVIRDANIAKPKKLVNKEWQQRARYDRHKLGLSAKQSLEFWPFDTKPTETEWLELSECS